MGHELQQARKQKAILLERTETISASVAGNRIIASTSESVVEEFIERELGAAHTGKKQRHVGPLPIILGIAGHRDLVPDDVPHLERVLREEFEALKKLYPSTSFILLSALADGADRLCAWAALDAGMRLISVLPMPRELYEMDFDEASTVEFRELLGKSEHWFEVPLEQPELENTFDDILEHATPRERQYARAGAYIASHCSILIAMWDGIPLDKIGGTSQIVRYKLEGVPEPYAPPHSELDAPDSGPVFQIVTPRESAERPDNPFEIIRMYPEGFESMPEAEQAYRDIYKRMEGFNEDAVKYAAELSGHFEKSREYVFPKAVHSSMPASLKEALDFYAIADVLSQRFQKRTFATAKVLLWFVFFAALFYELYSGPIVQPVMIALYLSMFLLAGASYAWANRRGYQTKYLDYRALAEGLRVQFFWKLAGLSDSAADYYMRKQKSELDWIRHAVRSCMTETCPEPETNEIWTTEEGILGRLKLVQKYWVDDQATYFGRAAHRDEEQLHRNERFITFLFGTTLLLAGIQLFLPQQNLYLVLCIAMLPVSAALIHSYLQKNALAEHTKQYDRMSGFYHRAKMHLEKLIEKGKLKEAQNFVAELGREALAENGDWILTHRDRPLEMPKGA